MPVVNHEMALISPYQKRAATKGSTPRRDQIDRYCRAELERVSLAFGDICTGS